MPAFVQLLHPGGEHGSDHGNIKEWNTGDHKRKFIRNAGSCLINNKVIVSELLFWCEWEPESVVIKIKDNAILHEPQYLHIPFYIHHDVQVGLQRTDPFVFGERFQYAICRHFNKYGPTKLRFLDKGSLVLFGSCLDGSFVIDTVFVVDEWIEYNRSNAESILKDKVSKTYWDTLIEPLLASRSDCGGSSDMYRLYFGATYNKPVNGMFSFFPCLLDNNAGGFARPIIRLDNVITDNLQQNFKCTDLENINEVKSLWDDVVRQVNDQGLFLGIKTKLPEQVG